MTDAAIVLDRVTRSFEGGRIPALRGVSFRVETGEVVALTGASGSGKSTILNLVGALDRADGGTVEVCGLQVGALRDPDAYRAGTIGFVFQTHNLLPTLTASENVEIAMFGRRSRRERQSRAAALLGEVGLRDRVTARPGTLSGGERQRVAIARALANEPPVILADEPTGSLDSATGRQVVQLLKDLREEHGTTILLVTNDNDIAALADRTLRLRDGVIADELTRVAGPRSAGA